MIAGAKAAEWASLLALERTARQQLAGASPTPAEVRAWWATVEAVLRTARREPQLVLPGELLTILERTAGALAVGEVPSFVRDASGEGQRPPGPIQRRHIQLAVAYRRACSAGGLRHAGHLVAIDDAHPVATLSGWFGISPSALRKWFAAAPTELTELEALTARGLKAQCERAGRIYAQAGRGHASIARRASKRA